MSLKVQYIDGTKIESVANKYTFVWRGSVEKYDARLKAKTETLLRQIGSPKKACGLCVDYCQSKQKEFPVYDATQQSSKLFHLCIKRFSGGIGRPIDKIVKNLALSVIHSCRYIIEGFVPKFSYFGHNPNFRCIDFVKSVKFAV